MTLTTFSARDVISSAKAYASYAPFKRQSKPMLLHFGEEASTPKREEKAPQKTGLRRGLGIACNVLLLTDGRIGVLKVRGYHNTLMAQWRPQQKDFYLEKATSQYLKAFGIADAMAVKTPLSLLSRYECLHALGKIYRAKDRDDTAQTYETQAEAAYALMKERLWPSNVMARLFKR